MSSSLPQANDHDSDIDSILTQPTSDRRLAEINRRMYQSLRTLDAELRREQRLAACQPHSVDSAALQAQTNSAQDAGAAAAAAGQSASDAAMAVGAGTTHGTMGVGGTAHAAAAIAGTAHATADSAIGANAITASLPVTSSAGASGAASTGAVSAHAKSARKAGLSNGRGGNGATVPKVVPGNDNDIVARRLRKAAEQESNPALRAKLWKEYTDYRQGTSAK